MMTRTILKIPFKPTEYGKITPNGLLLTVVIAIALWLPIYWLNASHPLAGRQQINACALALPLIKPLFFGMEIHSETHLPDFRPSVQNCNFHSGSNEDSLLWLNITSRKILFGAQQSHSDTLKFVESWYEESRASGNQLKRIEGPWRSGALIQGRQNLFKNRPELLIEDNGIIIRMGSQTLSPEQLIEKARQLIPALRKT